MPTVLNAQTGRQTGSSGSRRLRRENQIPGVLYGHGMEPMSLTVDRRDLRLALSGTAAFNTVLDLTVDGRVYPAIVKELQRHPVRRNVAHIDFIQVNLDEKITVAVPLRLEGEALAVVQNNGLVDPAVDSIEVSTTPRDIPDEFVIDITDFALDTVVRLADVPMPDGVTAIGDPDMPVVTVLITRAELEEEAEGVEAAEGAEAEGGAGTEAEGTDAAE